jgi:hypothetical protein
MLHIISQSTSPQTIESQLTINGGISMPYRETSTNTTLLTSDYCVTAMASGITIQIPTISTIRGQLFHVKNLSLSSITVSAWAGQTIDTDTNILLNPTENLSLMTRLSGGTIII